MRIVLDPGHGGQDPGASGYGMSEKTLTLDLAKQTAWQLTERYEGVQLMLTRNDDTYVSLSQRTELANRWQADFFLSLHHNAGGGTGFESYIYTRTPERTKAYQETLHNRAVQFLQQEGFPDRGRRTANFAVLRQTDMPAVLLENLFLDHVKDANYLKQAAFRRQLAAAIAAGVAQALALTRKKAPPASIPEPTEGLFRVQVGAFQRAEHAQVLAEQLQAEGFDSYIYRQSGMFKVQAGAFSEWENAEVLARRLQENGFDTYIYREEP